MSPPRTLDPLATGKRCPRCYEVRHRQDFHKASRTNDGLQTYCKGCMGEIARGRRKANPEQARVFDRKHNRKRTPLTPEQRRNAMLRFRYGIDAAEYDALLAKQDGRCAVCHAETADLTGRRLHVDHDHATGQVRGLLCTNCNRGIGCLQDDPDRLRAAIAYLTGGQ